MVFVKRVVLLVFLIGFLCFKVVAADEVTGISQLDTVVVSATRIPLKKDQISGDVAVFTREDIEKYPVRNLTEVLHYIPGVDVQMTSQFGQATALSINGSEARHVLLMVDGIPFNTQLSGQANPSRISIEHIERIEVIKGAASSVWGSSLGGVVNVITKDVGTIKKPQGKFTSSFAEFSTTKNSLDLSGKLSDLRYLVSGTFFETDGTRDRSDVQEIKTFTKLAYDLTDEAKITGSFGYSGAHAREGVLPSNRWDSKPYYSRYGRFDVSLDQEEVKGHIAYKYNDQDVKTDTFNATTGARTASTVSNNVYHGISLNNHFEFLEDHLFVVGGDFEWHKLKSNNYLDKAESISMQAPYINTILRWEDVDVTTGVRFDYNQRFGSQTSPSLGGVYHFGDEHHSNIRARISRGFNAPPLLWVFNSDPSMLVGANPDLKAERSLLYEVGLESKLFSPLKMELNAYRADVRDGIALVFKGGLFVRDNFEKFRRQGGLLLLRYDLNDSVEFYGSGAFNDVENRVTGEIVRNQGVARQGFTFGTNYKNSHGFKFNFHGYYNRWSSTPAAEANDRKVVLDVKLRQEIKEVTKATDLELFLNVYNLTNSKYWSSITFPLPKRYFEGGFSVKF